MTKHLVIVESPAKCSKIAGFLGADYTVIATMGHIRALEEDLDAIGLDKGFEPRYHFLTKEKAKAINGIKAAAIGCNSVYLAADDDREGEAIAYSACLLLKLNPVTTKRAVFHEITRDAVCNAIANPRTLDMNKVWAQQSRAVLDMMVGFTISPLLWKHVGNSLSAGRCQTPALRLVYEREQDIQNFRSEASMGIKGVWNVDDSNYNFDALLTDDLEDEESALNYLENHSTDPTAVVSAANTTTWSEGTPSALITSTLQQQTSSLFRIGPKPTMSSAQRLYEQGYITYMRTDSIIMSEEAIISAKKQVEILYGKEYIGSSQQKKKVGRPSKKADDSKPKAQEAHEAIRPTHFETRELPTDEDWSAVDRKIYCLIWLRAIQSVMATAIGEKRSVKFIASGDEEADFEWLSTWKRTTFEGWKKADTRATINNNNDEEAPQTEDAVAWSASQNLKEGSKLRWTTLEAFPKATKALPRYTEATLVRELEKRGIGRPSTFAMLISTIQEKNYVEKKNIEGQDIIQKRYILSKVGMWPPTSDERKVCLGAEKDKLVPTGLGASVIEFALKHFPDLFDYPFTAQMELRLDKIAGGEEPWKRVLEDTWKSYKERYTTLKAAKSSTEDSDHKRDLGNGLFAIKTRKGPLLLREGATKEESQFFGWPSAVNFDTLTSEQALAHIESLSSILGEYDGAPILVKSGKFGKYIEHKEIKISYKGEQESLTDVIGRLDAKVSAETDSKQIGPFEIRKGPYGLYMFKRDAVKKQFISVPSGINIDELTVAAATTVFQKGLEAKARSKQFKVYGNNKNNTQGNK